MRETVIFITISIAMSTIAFILMFSKHRRFIDNEEQYLAKLEKRMERINKRLSKLQTETIVYKHPIPKKQQDGELNE